MNKSENPAAVARWPESPARKFKNVPAASVSAPNSETNGLSDAGHSNSNNNSSHNMNQRAANGSIVGDGQMNNNNTVRREGPAARRPDSLMLAGRRPDDIHQRESPVSPVVLRDDNMNRVNEILATTTSAAVGRSGSGVNYGTFGGTTPSPQAPPRPIPEKDYDEKSDEEEPTSDEEDEETVRMYNVSSGPAAKNERTFCVSVTRPPSASAVAADGQLLAQLSTLRATGPSWQSGRESDENGNSGFDGVASTAEERPTAGRGQYFGGEEGGAPAAKASLLVTTTTVSFDENHKRNSIHLFVADVNENEHINEAEETTRV